MDNKTAMQELIEEMQRIYTLPYVNGTTFMEGIMKYANQLLEKEKEQMLNQWQKGFEDAKYIYNQTKSNGE